MRELYAQSIKSIFVQNKVIEENDLADVKVSFDSGSQKVFVTFRNDQSENNRGEYGTAAVAGRIVTEVYKSIKMRDSRLRTSIRVIR